MSHIDNSIHPSSNTPSSTSQEVAIPMVTQQEDNTVNALHVGNQDELAAHTNSQVNSDSHQGVTQTPGTSSLETDDEGFQAVSRKKSKGKLPVQTVCSLPCAMNTRKPFKPGLSKFVPIRNVPQLFLQV